MWQPCITHPRLHCGATPAPAPPDQPHLDLQLRCRKAEVLGLGDVLHGRPDAAARLQVAQGKTGQSTPSIRCSVWPLAKLSLGQAQAGRAAPTRALAACLARSARSAWDRLPSPGMDFDKAAARPPQRQRPRRRFWRPLLAAISLAATLVGLAEWSRCATGPQHPPCGSRGLPGPAPLRQPFEPPP